MYDLYIDEFSKSYLDASWTWLSDPEIKELIMSSDLTRKEQQRWFETLTTRKDYFIWGIRYGDKKIGAFGIKNIDYKERIGEYFGYIGEKEYWGKGIGKELLSATVNYAKDIHLNKLYLMVSKTNIRAIRLYNTFGFKAISLDNGVYKMEYPF